VQLVAGLVITAGILYIFANLIMFVMNLCYGQPEQAFQSIIRIGIVFLVVYLVVRVLRWLGVFPNWK
jgi:hypothetical protein